jgi:hypothetical protein
LGKLAIPKRLGHLQIDKDSRDVRPCMLLMDSRPVQSDMLKETRGWRWHSSKRIIFGQFLIFNLWRTGDIIFELLVAPSIHFSRLSILYSLRDLNDGDKGFIDPVTSELLKHVNVFMFANQRS